MTVVGALVLNPKKGMEVIADAKGTYGGRTIDTMEKIYTIAPKNKPTYFVGFAGSVPNHIKILREINKGILTKQPESKEQLEEVIENSYKTAKRKSFEDGLLEIYGATLDEFKKGMLSPQLTERIMKAAEDHRGFDVHGIIGGRLKSNEEFSLSSLAYPGIVHPEINYTVTGSGSDIWDIEASNRLQRMNAEKRKDIPIDLGARILLDATVSSWRNVGVGGTGETPGQMFIVYNDNSYELKPEQVTLLFGAVFAERKGVLDREYVNKIIRDVVETRTEAKDVLKELETKIDHETLTRLFFERSLHF
jgi:hypothetical protein